MVTVLASMLVSYTMYGVYTKTTESNLVAIGREISTLSQLEYSDFITTPQLLNEVSKRAKEENVVIWVVDSDNKIWAAVDPSEKTQITEDEIIVYYNEMMDDVEQGKIVKVHSNDDEFFKNPVITIAYPIISEDTNTVVGSVFVHQSVEMVGKTMGIIYSRIIIAGIIAAIASMIVAMFLAWNITRPITVVTRATKELAKGNFNVRIQNDAPDEIGQLARTFNDVAEELGKNEHIRQTFVADVSHELRSPMTSIQGLISGMLDGTISEGEREQYLNIILSETKRLTKLVNNLLDLTKMESNTMQPEKKMFDINELICRALFTFESKINAKNIDVDINFCNEKQEVEADPDKISQVLVNIIENAVKFIPEGGKLSIYTTETQASVFVNINNTGDPIPPDEIKYLFERFYKADKSRNREKEGTGLGLAIVKKILDSHGQKIWVESTAEGGTTFTFTLKKM